jgi:surface antigen
MLQWKQFRPGRRRASRWALVAALALCAGPAAAQLMPMMRNPAWPGLSSDDIDRMHAAELRLFEGHSIGTIERWRNPDTGNAGEVELVREYEAKGLPCRSLSYIVRFAENARAQGHYALNWCRLPSGDWKIVTSEPPA